MADPAIRYDEPSDTLHVAFAPGRSATRVEFSENILLRVDNAARITAGLTVFNDSLLAQRTEMGPRTFALTGVAELPQALRGLALTSLLSEPVPSSAPWRRIRPLPTWETWSRSHRSRPPGA